MPARLTKKNISEVLKIAKKLTMLLIVEVLLDQILNFTTMFLSTSKLIHNLE